MCSPALRATPSRQQPRAGASPDPGTRAPTATPAARPTRASRTTCSRRTAPGSTRTTSLSRSRRTRRRLRSRRPASPAGYYTSLSVPVTLNGGSDSESGLAAGSSVVERDEAPLDNSDGSCNAFPGSWSTVTLSGGNDTSGRQRQVLPLPRAALRQRRQPGRLGRRLTAKVDTSAPSDPSFSYGSFTNAAVNGGIVWYRPSAASGQFQVTASSSDSHSGVASYGFPAAASGWSVSGSGALAHATATRARRPIRPSRTTSLPRTAPGSTRTTPLSRSRRTRRRLRSRRPASPRATTRHSPSRSR